MARLNRTMPSKGKRLRDRRVADSFESVILVGSSAKTLDERIDEKWSKIRSDNKLLKERLALAKRK